LPFFHKAKDGQLFSEIGAFEHKKGEWKILSRKRSGADPV
jgi:hypothetical protein